MKTSHKAIAAVAAVGAAITVGAAAAATSPPTADQVAADAIEECSEHEEWSQAWQDCTVDVAGDDEFVHVLIAEQTADLNYGESMWVLLHTTGTYQAPGDDLWAAPDGYAGLDTAFSPAEQAENRELLCRGGQEVMQELVYGTFHPTAWNVWVEDHCQATPPAPTPTPAPTEAEWTPAPAPASGLDYSTSVNLLRDLWDDYPQSWRDGMCEMDVQAQMDEWGVGDIYHPDAVADFMADVC